MIRAMVRRALVLAAAFAAALTPVTCLGESSKPLPAKATQELPAELLALLEQKKMPKYSPIVVRLFKEEAELEVWKQDTTGRFQILKTYPICRWSGDLGPKLYEGDRQAPEGFYTITPELMNPNSNFYLSINLGYPNSFDKANKRNGSFLMIHGDCWSSGCYAMTDEQISEIYSLARDSLSGRPSFQVQAYPFRLTPANLARHRNSPEPAPSGKCSRSATIISRRRNANPRWMCATAAMYSMRNLPRIRRTLSCSTLPKNVPPLSSIRKSRGGRWRRGAPTSSNTRDCLKTMCRLPRSTADWTAE